MRKEDNQRAIVTCSSDESISSSIVQRKVIKIVVESTISSVGLLADGQQYVSGDKNGKVRWWRMEDGVEVGAPIDAESAIRCLATSQDGKWSVTGTKSGRVTVWDAESREKLTWFAKAGGANSVDISSDGTKIAIAWGDKTVSVYSLPDNEKQGNARNCSFHTVRFSPDGLLFACGVESGKSSSLGIYNSNSSQNASLQDIEITTRSVSWTSDSKQLFALSSDGDIYCVDVSNGRTLSKWPIHSNDSPTCISLSSNGIFIAACANSSISFWDTSTHEQIGFVIHHPHSVNSMAISPNHDLVFVGNSTIVLWDLRNVLSVPYIDDHVGRYLFPRSASSQFNLLVIAKTGYKN